MKKLVLSGCLAAAMMCAASAYAEGSLELGSVNFLSPDFYPMYRTDSTSVSIRASVTNGSDSAESGVLISAVYKEEDMSLVSVKTQQITGLEAGGRQTLSEEIEIPDTTGYILNVYLWDSEENGISLSQTYGIYDRQIVPEAPSGLTVEESGYNEITLSWLMPDHNLQLRDYEIFVNGESAGTSRTESFTIEGLDYGEEYEIEVAATDISGTSSLKSEPISANTEQAAYMILGQANQYVLFNRDIRYGDTFDSGYYSEVVTAGPEGDLRECRKIEFIKPYNGNADGAANYLMFGVDDGYITPDDNEVTIKVTCLDEGTDTIGIDYNSPSNAYTRMTLPKTGTGEWKTFTFHLTDAAFNNQQSNSYDFRVNTGESNTAEYIYKVEVFKGTVD